MKVLLVEDSRTVVAYIEAALAEAPDITLLPTATDGQTAVLTAQMSRPDLILMDLRLPGLDGLGAIAEIMAIAPCPIVVLSAYLNDPNGDQTFRSLSAGAVDVLAKPQSLDPKAFAAFRANLLKTIRVMKDARVIRRRVPAARAASHHSYGLAQAPYELVIIGGSTGAPEQIYQLLRCVPSPHRLPIIICQHILRGFEGGFADWLRQTGHDVRVAQGGERLRAGGVYVAPTAAECRVTPNFVEVSALSDVSSDAFTPSIDILFHSVAKVYRERAAAFLLSGMGSDGARGLLQLRMAGALTVAQSGESCVVDGMPAVARQLGAVLYDLRPSQMCELFARLHA